MAKIIDGKTIAGRIRSEIAAGVKALAQEKGITPKLSVVLVGDDPASQIYVRNKEKACGEVGILSETHRLPAATRQEELIKTIKALNQDQGIDGILVQLPLLKGLNEKESLEEIDYKKDVDGIHPFNLGKLLRGEGPAFEPCTPQGIIELILSTGIEIKGKQAVVVGRSNIVGKPVAIMLLQRHATVTICHSRTNDLGGVTRQGDILVVAAGRPGLIKGEMIKSGAVVIDVGTSRVADKWVGDVDFKEAVEVAGFITPVPGGVGPMTIAMLLKNTLKAARLRVAK